MSQKHLDKVPTPNHSKIDKENQSREYSSFWLLPPFNSLGQRWKRAWGNSGFALRTPPTGGLLGLENICRTYGRVVRPKLLM